MAADAAGLKGATVGWVDLLASLEWQFLMSLKMRFKLQQLRIVLPSASITNSKD